MNLETSGAGSGSEFGPKSESRPGSESSPGSQSNPGPESIPGSEANSRSEANPKPESSLEPKAEIALEEFARLEIRIARVLFAEPHPNADRLLKLQIDLGGETRQLVAGIASRYRPEELIGRSVVVLANLKPARLRGEISQGMLLAASAGEEIALLAPDKEVPAGSKVR